MKLINLTSHLNSIRAGIRTVHRYPVDDTINASKETADNSLQEIELGHEISRRYYEASDQIRANDPRLPLRNRAQRLSNAKYATNRKSFKLGVDVLYHRHTLFLEQILVIGKSVHFAFGDTQTGLPV
jgi:hypothetical protein